MTNLKRLLLKEITPQMNDETVSFGGWVHELRDFGGLKFIILKDRTGILQLTLHKSSVSKDLMNLFNDLTKESALFVEGKVQKSEKASGGREVIPSKIEILGKADAPTPIDTSGKIESDLSVRLDWRFLDLRDPKKLALFKIRSKMFRLTSDFFDKEGFTCIQTPKITSAGVESGAELFPVKYFNRDAFLSQSPQMYKQMMVLAGFERVYEIGPVFRAEKSLTTRHLTEFTGVDFEMGFIESHHDVMDVIENYLKFLLSGLKKEVPEELALFEVNPIVPKKIPRLEFKEIQKILKGLGKIVPDNEDLDPEGERMLSQYVLEKFNEEFVFCLNYPYNKRPFYHMKPQGEENGTKSFDLLWNGVEIATGAQREHRIKVLSKQAEEKGIDFSKMNYYADMFRYGTIPHGGVGFGLDRLTQRLLKLNNIKEALLLPRDPERLTP